MNIPAWIPEDLSFVLFVVLVGYVFVACLRILFRIANKSVPNKKLKSYECVLLCAGAVGFGCFIYGLIEPFSLDLTRIELHSSKINANSSKIRIIHFSDLHCDGVSRVQKKLLDIINNKSGLPLFKSCMKDASSIAPVFAVRGNNDVHGTQKWDRFGDTGVQLVSGQPRVISVRGTKLWIAGVDVEAESVMQKTLAGAPADAYSIFLYHYPAGVGASAAQGIDLYCAGHTHGGQVRLPFYGAIVTNSVLGKKYEAGEYQVGSTIMYVNRGIGMMGIPVRFLCPPEVTEIDIYPSTPRQH